MKRREFVAFVGASLGSLTVGCGPAPSPTWDALAVRAATCFDPASWAQVRRVGQASLGALDVGDEMALERELSPTLAWLESAETLDCEARAVRDFEALAVRDIEGWVLSASEVHLAMLLELFDVRAETG
ncbi:MAG: hypothetical protein AB8I08_25520 [Sandaracinaceae bacterium]